MIKPVYKESKNKAIDPKVEYLRLLILEIDKEEPLEVEINDEEKE